MRGVAALLAGAISTVFAALLAEALPPAAMVFVAGFLAAAAIRPVPWGKPTSAKLNDADEWPWAGSEQNGVHV